MPFPCHRLDAPDPFPSPPPAAALPSDADDPCPAAGDHVRPPAAAEGDRTPTPSSVLSPGVASSAADSPAPATPPSFLAPPSSYAVGYPPQQQQQQQQYYHMSHLPQHLQQVQQGPAYPAAGPQGGAYASVYYHGGVGGGGGGGGGAYHPPPGGPSSYPQPYQQPYPASHQHQAYAPSPQIQDPAGARSPFAPGGGGGGAGQEDLWAPPEFTPQDLVVHGPSVPFGFKSPLPLPLPAPFSPDQPPSILQPFHATPVSPAPPVYPIYAGPQVLDEVEMPSAGDWEVWRTTDAADGIVDMLADDGEGELPARPTPICKRCHDYKVECAWPGLEGQGSCSNCFFAYSACEVIAQSEATPVQRPSALADPPRAGLSALPPPSAAAAAAVSSSSSPSAGSAGAGAPYRLQAPRALSFGQAAAELGSPATAAAGQGPTAEGSSAASAAPSHPAGSPPVASPAAPSSLPPTTTTAAAATVSPSSAASPRPASPSRRLSEMEREMERLRAQVGRLQMHAQLGLGRVQDELLRNGAGGGGGLVEGEQGKEGLPADTARTAERAGALAPAPAGGASVRSSSSSSLASGSPTTR